ncbi:MAG: phospholipid N-methyltransferase, partial [Myxococcota bacterium]
MSAWTFLREFTRDPVKVGAVAPSGRALAALEIDAADIH